MNPFTMVFTELWNMLLAHPAFVRDVKEGNRIRFDDPNDRDPMKRVVASADLPEVAVLPGAGVVNIMSNSNTSMITRTFQVLVSTGDYRYSAILGSVEWYCFCAFTGWKNRLSTLTWKTRPFVKTLQVSSVLAGHSDPAQNRNISGWSAVWAVDVGMYFETQDLLDELRVQHEEAN